MKLRTKPISLPGAQRPLASLREGGGFLRSKKTEGARVQINCARTPFPSRGVINFFFPKKKKLQKEVGEPAVRSPRRAGYRPKKFRPHLTQGLSVQMGCHRGTTDSPTWGFFPAERVQQNLNSITRPARRAPYGHRRRLCVGASVCAQNKFHTFGSEATVSLPLTGEVARNARRRGLTAPANPHNLPSAHNLHSSTFGSGATVSLPLTGSEAALGY